MYIRIGKRLFDIAVCLLAFPLVLLILIMICPFIFLEDRGPIFYNTHRLGKDGHIFMMYKLRSMKKNAPQVRNEDGSTYCAGDDPRLTRIGRMIRKTSLDELPQILNVIRGEMSLIGPRPDLPDHIHYYTEDEKRKLQVLPGISGYNQAYFRNATQWKGRLKNDVYYVEHLSLFLDIRIFLKTLQGILGRKGIYSGDDMKCARGGESNEEKSAGCGRLHETSGGFEQ